MAKTPTDVLELKSAVEQLNKATEEQYQIEMKLAQAKNASAIAEGEHVSRADKLRQISEINKELAGERIRQLNQSDAILRKEIASLEEKIAAGEINIQVAQRQISQNQELLNLGEAGRRQEIESAKALASANQQRLKRIELSDQLASRVGQQIGVTEEWKSGTAGLVVQLASLDASMDEVTASIRDQINLENVLGSTLQQIITQTISLFKELDTAAATFRKATAAGHEYNLQIAEVEENLRTLGFSADDVQRSFAALYTEYAGFTRLTKAEQTVLAETTTQLTRFGISAKAAAASVGFLGDALGKTPAEIAETQRGLVALGKDLGIPPSIIFTQFNQASKELSKHGDDMENVFRQLAAESKATGLSIQSLIKVSEGFDTFEGAATKAAKLNAILGGPYLDTAQLINMHEAERNQYIRDQINLTGLNIESMSRAERQMIATGLGFDNVGDAMKFLNDQSLDELEQSALDAAFSEEELADATQDALSLMEKFEAILKGLAVSLAPLLEPLHWVADGILKLQKGFKALPTWGKAAIGTVVALTAAMVLFGDKSEGAVKGVTTGIGDGVKGMLEKSAEGVNSFKDVNKGALLALNVFGGFLKNAGIGALAFGAGLLAAGFGLVKIYEGLKKLIPLYKEHSATLSSMRNEFSLFKNEVGIKATVSILGTAKSFAVMSASVNTLPVQKFARFVGLMQTLKAGGVDPFVATISGLGAVSTASGSPIGGAGLVAASPPIRSATEQISAVKGATATINKKEERQGLHQVISDAIKSGFAGSKEDQQQQPVRNIELKIDRHVLGRVLDGHFDEKVGLS